MKKPIYIVTLLTFCCFAFWSCEKKLFKKVEVSGKVVNYISKTPVQTQLQLWNTEQTGNRGAVYLGTTSTNSDGTFDLKAPADKEGVYFLIWGGSNDYFLQVDLQDGHNIDIGNILDGVFTFFCKITLVSVSNSAIDIGADSFNSTASAPSFHFNPGTSTQLLVSQTYNYNSYQQNNGGFPISYKTTLGGISKDSTIYVPAPNADTLSVTINY